MVRAPSTLLPPFHPFSTLLQSSLLPSLFHFLPFLSPFFLPSSHLLLASSTFFPSTFLHLYLHLSTLQSSQLFFSPLSFPSLSPVMPNLLISFFLFILFFNFIFACRSSEVDKFFPNFIFPTSTFSLIFFLSVSLDVYFLFSIHL